MSVSVKRTQGFLLALMALAAGLARAGEVQLSGQVTVDGRKPEAPVTLLVTAVQDAELDEQYAGEVVTDDQGRFSAQVSADRGARIVVKARTPGVPAGEETMVLAGQGEAVAGASDKIDLNVAFARVRGNVLKFGVCDQRGIPASRIKVSSQVYRSAGANRVTVDSEIVETATDQDGRFALIVTPGDTRDRKIEIASAGVGGSTYRGVVRLAGKDLPAAYGKELKIQVTREDLAVVVSIKWDPEVSDKPFDPRANRFPGQTLLVEGLPNTERSVDEKGEVRLYEVPPGARVLALGVNTRLRYRMTRGTEKLVVPERAQWPLRHVVMIAPVQFVEARYVFSDSRTGKAVAGVRVRGSLGQAVSDDLGRAVLKCLPGEEVFISGDACSAVRLGAPRKSEVNATKVSLRLYPTVSGKITEQVTKKPVTLTTVELRGTARWDVRGDEFGRFAL